MAEIRKPYGPRVRVQQKDFGPSRTKQSERREADINFIVNRYQETGVMAHFQKYSGEYGEFDSTDFHQAMNMVASAKSMFESLPSSVRNMHQNDPAKFMDWIHDENNAEKAREMGLLPPDRDSEANLIVTGT